MNEIKEYTEIIFEDIKHINEKGNEYWLAREFQKVLEYKDWRNLNKVIDKNNSRNDLLCYSITRDEYFNRNN